MRLGDTPVPIPNTMVKTQAADGTALETVWESRWLPEYTINLLHELVVTRAIVRSTILNVRNTRQKTAELKSETVLIDTDTSESSELNTVLVIEGLC